MIYFKKYQYLINEKKMKIHLLVLAIFGLLALGQADNITRQVTSVEVGWFKLGRKWPQFAAQWYIFPFSFSHLWNNVKYGLGYVQLQSTSRNSEKGRSTLLKGDGSSSLWVQCHYFFRVTGSWLYHFWCFYIFPNNRKLTVLLTVSNYFHPLIPKTESTLSNSMDRSAKRCTPSIRLYSKCSKFVSRNAILYNWIANKGYHPGAVE